MRKLTFAAVFIASTMFVAIDAYAQSKPGHRVDWGARLERQRAWQAQTEQATELQMQRFELERQGNLYARPDLPRSGSGYARDSAGRAVNPITGKAFGDY